MWQSQIAAYPVLIPLYLAQYEYEVLDESYIINFILDVSSRSVCASSHTIGSARLISTQGRIICEVVPQAIRDSMGKEFATYRDGDKSPGFANVKRLMAPRSSDHLAQRLNEWVDKRLANPGTAKLLADESAVDFDDLRVREFVEQERQANYHYLGICADIVNLRELLKVSFLSSHSEHLCHLTQQMTTGMTKGKIISISFNIRPKMEAKNIGPDTTQDLLSSLEEKRIVMKPQWWAEWEKSSCSADTSSST
jgi:hypothetical protein